MDDSEPLDDLAPVFCASSGPSPGVRSRLRMAGAGTGVDEEGACVSAGGGVGDGLAGPFAVGRVLLDARWRMGVEWARGRARRAPRVSTAYIILRGR